MITWGRYLQGVEMEWWNGKSNENIGPIYEMDHKFHVFASKMGGRRCLDPMDPKILQIFWAKEDFY